MSRRCANCHVDLSAAPVERDGRTFCCAGCALGGPCGCAYSLAWAEEPRVGRAARTEVVAHARGGRQARGGHPRPPDLGRHATIRGTKSGDAVVRIGTHASARRVLRGLLVPRPGTGEPTSPLGIGLLRLKRLLLGSPIPTHREAQERLNNVRALAIFSSDALSSVAHAGEETMKVLLLAVVVASYRQTIGAYPAGGGAHVVAGESLGRLPGLVAAAALLIDYVLTVAASSVAGVAALTLLWPGLLSWTVELGLATAALVRLVNLREVRGSGALFALSTYLFVEALSLLLAVGFARLTTGTLSPASALPPGGVHLRLLRALAVFAQGCSAMTSTGASANGVPAFRKPEAHNARVTLVWMGLLLGSTFLGMNALAAQVGIRPAADGTVLSQLGRTVLGPGPLWWRLRGATALLLLLAANTAFAGFPRLASLPARDGYLPRFFQFRGDRLTFTAGSVSLALLVAFRGVACQRRTLSDDASAVSLRRGGGPLSAVWL